MTQESQPQKERTEFKKILDAAARFHQWWKEGEAKLKARQEADERAKKKAA